MILFGRGFGIFGLGGFGLTGKFPVKENPVIYIASPMHGYM